MKQRQEHPWDVRSPYVFYHIACMNNWREVVCEQLSLLAHVGLRTVVSAVLGSSDDACWAIEAARLRGITLSVPFIDSRVDCFETPTLTLLYETAARSPLHACLYFHTKGVSQPLNPNRRAWRQVMQKFVVADWRVNLRRLAIADMVGVDWQDSWDFPHFAGNFFMARSDWIASLESPEQYRRKFPKRLIAWQPWERMHAEMWIGSKPHHLVESLYCRNGCLWEDWFVNSIDRSIENFSNMS